MTNEVINAVRKDCGIPFFDTIPSHWNVSLFKKIFKEVNDRVGSASGLDLLTLSKKQGVIYRRESIGDVEESLLSRAESFEDYKVVSPGMLVMNIMLAWDGVLSFSDKYGFVSPAYNVFKSNENISYFKYFIQLPQLHSYFRANSKGIVDFRLRLYSNTFLSLKTIVPPLYEQTAIANYLDHETACIDSEIKKEERRIELLEELLQATIFETVTKGLDKNAEMVDSGIDWIGKIPTGWEVKRVKDCVNLGKKSTIPAANSDVDGEFDFFVSGVNVKKTNSYNLDTMALLLPTGGSYYIHRPSVIPCAYSTDVLPLIVESENLCIDYIFFTLKALGFIQSNILFQGSGLKHLQRDLFLNTCIPICQLSNQRLIAEYLNNKTNESAARIKNSEKRIKLLKELKQATIYEAVTGKTEIPSHFYPRE